MEPIWYDEFPKGVSTEFSYDANLSCVDLLETSAEKFGVNPAFAHGNSELSFHELNVLSKDFAAYLQQRAGLHKGNRVAIMLPNWLQYPIALFGIMRIGGVIVNVNPQYTARELKHQLKDSGAKAIVIASGALPVLGQIQDSTDIETVFVTDVNEPLSFDERVGAEKGTFAEALVAGKSLDLDETELNGGDTLFLQYTGGTTGLSKGAMLSHRNLLANVAQTTSWFSGFLNDGQERFLSPLPLYHIFGLMVNCFFSVSKGAVSVLISDPKNPQNFLDAFNHYQCTLMTGVNTLYNSLPQIGEFSKIEFKLKCCIGGGAAIQRSVADSWQKATGCHIMEGYGLSETSPVLTLNRPDSGAYTGSIGLPLPSTDISLRDENGEEVGFGEAGELCAKGPQVMSGYWNKPESKADYFTKDGYFRTGDVATVDEKGYFRIIDRKKDMILVSGFNVFPNEIEAAVSSCPGILENACIGIPDEKTGEAVKVFAVCKPGFDVSEAALLEHCRNLLTGYKVPKRVEFVNELPKSSVGKILRRELRS